MKVFKQPKIRQVSISYSMDRACLNYVSVNLMCLLFLDIIQNQMTQVFMRQLVDKLGSTIQNEYSSRIQTKVAIFVVFLIVTLAAFFLFWIPFLNSLNFQIYKTKLMLMIIPLEILMKIKNVAKVLQSQSFLTNNSKKRSKNE